MVKQWSAWSLYLIPPSLHFGSSASSLCWFERMGSVNQAWSGSHIPGAELAALPSNGPSCGPKAHRSQPRALRGTSKPWVWMTTPRRSQGRALKERRRGGERGCAVHGRLPRGTRSPAPIQGAIFAQGVWCLREPRAALASPSCPGLSPAALQAGPFSPRGFHPARTRARLGARGGKPSASARANCWSSPFRTGAGAIRGSVF